MVTTDHLLQARYNLFDAWTGARKTNKPIAEEIRVLLDETDKLLESLGLEHWKENGAIHYREIRSA